MPPTGKEPFVARAAELARLVGAFRRAEAGEGSLAVILAEAGGGKTRLVEELAATVPVVWGRALEDAGAAYRPWRQAFRRLDVPFPWPAAGSDPDARPGQLLEIAEEAIEALAAACARGPVAIALDDLHWADEASLHLLRLVAPEVGRLRLLLLAASRPPEPGTPLEGTLGQLMGKPAVTTLRLPALTAADVAEYLAGRADGAAAAWVHQQSGGNPLYVRELSRLLADEAVPAPGSPTWMPVELRSVLNHRLAHLEPAHRDLVGAASALGDEFAVQFLEQLVGHPVADGIDAAVRQGVLVLDPDAPGWARFSHGLVRTALYHDMTSAQRVDVHRRAAELLEAEGAADHDDRIAELARHWLRAASTPDDRRRAIARLRQAAGVATRRLAFDEAVRLLQSAAATARLGPAGPAERAEVELELAAAEFADGLVLQSVATARRSVALAERAGRPDLAAEAALVASGVGDEATLPALLALKEGALRLQPPGPTVLRVRLEAQIAQARAELHGPGAAEAGSRRALDEAEALGDPDALVDAIRARHFVRSGPDGVEERRRLAARMTELGRDPRRGMAAVWGRRWAIDAAFELGDMAAAHAEAAELSLVVDWVRRPLAGWHLLMTRASFAINAGRFDEAEGLAHQARRLGHRLEDQSAVGVTYALTGEVDRLRGHSAEQAERRALIDGVPHPIAAADVAYISACLGDVASAQRLHDRVKPFIPALPVDARWLPVLALFSQTACALGDPDAAGGCYDQLLPYADRCVAGGAGSVACQGSVAGVLARLAVLLGRPDEAAMHFAAALAATRRLGLAPYLAETLFHAARFDAARDPGAARAEAAEARRIATSLGMQTVAAESAALLDRLPAAATGTAPDPLTRREREVAALVAQGRSNREVADQLFLSERTVETHVSRILAKLELGSRTQLAAWVLAPDKYVPD